jgi:drug/metabolite transporter superfamily protein YnfA
MSFSLKNKKDLGLLLTIILPLIALYAFVPVMVQSQAYHHFSDINSIFGIPNFHNVASNLVFIFVSAIAFKDFFKNPSSYGPAWFVFFLGILLVAPGSAYYHYTPTDATLVWDRLPMTIGFMGLVSSLLIDIFKINNKKTILALTLILGCYSVWHWVAFNDLRLYTWVQLNSILVMLYIALVYKSNVIIKKYLFAAVAFYIAAKYTEAKDVQVDELLGYSGHSIKHILAGFGVYFLVLMKRKINKAS